MTTLEIVQKHVVDVCDEGEVFARENPDPREAILVALAAQPQGGPRGPHDCDPWHFLRWCVYYIDGETYEDLSHGLHGDTFMRKHAMACGDWLLKWLDRMGL